MKKFIIKHIDNRKPQLRLNMASKAVTNKNNNNINENKVMTTDEKIAMAQEVLSNESAPKTFKRVKKDKGLIERTESSITVLTEDNKELLKD